MRRALWVLMASAVILAAGCSSGDGEKDDGPADAQQLTTTMGDSLAFDQPGLTVHAGRPVLLTVRNTGNTDHDFMIMDLPAREVKNAAEAGHGESAAGTIVGHPKLGGEVTVRFTPTTPGAYEFFCSVTGHKDAGMRGVLTVV